jgi:two-component system cell cycle sensor histidine kinase/response regulator CckA
LTFDGRRARLVLVNDVSERRRLEEQLRQSQKMEAIGQLAGGVAHDFNNLLTLISGYSELAREALGDHPASQNVDEIQKAAERAASLTRQLLAFSRRQVLQMRLLDLNALVLEVETMLRRLIGEDVELTTLYGPELGLVLADPVQMDQVLLNLAVNARDAMPQGGSLVIRTTNVDVSRAGPVKSLSPGRYVLLSISDTGTGMDEQTHQRLFEPFFTTKRLGTGLGLSTVYGIVKQGGGDIEVISELGKGTTFEIYLPRAQQSGAPLERARASAAPTQGTETVLLVEDEDGVRGLVRDVLQRRGFTVLEAAGGPAAMQLAERYQGSIDLLLSDIVMPQMSGLELAADLRRQRPKLRTLFMSGHAPALIDRHGVLDEHTPLLAKPFTPESLLRRVREVLDAT